MSYKEIFSTCRCYKIVVDYDNDPLNPFEEFDDYNGVFFAVSSKRYIIGSKNMHEDLIQYNQAFDNKSLTKLRSHLNRRIKICDKMNDCTFRSEKYLKLSDIVVKMSDKIEERWSYRGDEYENVEYVNNLFIDPILTHHLFYRKDLGLGETYYLPLYIYDHSGIAFSTTPFHCPWDSGQIGYVYISKNDFKKTYLSGGNLSDTEEEKRAKELLKNAVSQLNDISCNNCFVVTLYKRQEDGNYEEVDSIGGVWGEDCLKSVVKEFTSRTMEL